MFDLLYALFLVIGVVFAYLLKGKLFPSSFQPSLEAIIVSAVPGKSNMVWHYSDTYPPITAQFLFEKFVNACEKHFASIRFSPFYLFTNISVVSLVIVALSRFRNRLEYILPALIFLGLYAAMIVLQQNHPRYQQIIAPITFFVIMLAVDQVRLTYLRRYVPFVCLMLVVANTLMVHTSRIESHDEAVGISELENSLKAIGSSARLISVDIYPHNPITYVLGSREFLSVRTNLLEREKIAQAAEIFNPSHVISSREMEHLFFNKQIVLEKTFYSSFYKSEIYLYRYSQEPY
jgi:hypothetical protein